MSLLQVGQKVQNYEIKKQLGAGGFGAVYEAVDCMLGRRVAIKVLSHRDHVIHRQRFRDEGRLLAKLQHPKIVQIYALGELEDGSSFLAMELFGKGSIQHYFPIGTPIDFKLAVQIIKDLLSALVEAHAQGIVHRDIKEANLLYDPDTQCTKLCDFGIARSTEPLTDEAQSTAEGRVIGTCHYIAPERYKGIKDDPRSDLFAVGVVFYRLLAGHRPFEQYAKERPENIVVMQRVLNEEPPRLPSHIPNAMASVCYQLLAKNLEVRFATAKLALDALLLAENTPQTESVSMSMEINPILPNKSTFQLIDDQDTKPWLVDQPAQVKMGNETKNQPKRQVKSIYLGFVALLSCSLIFLLALYLSPSKPQVVKLATSPTSIIQEKVQEKAQEKAQEKVQEKVQIPIKKETNKATKKIKNKESSVFIEQSLEETP